MRDPPEDPDHSKWSNLKNKPQFYRVHWLENAFSAETISVVNNRPHCYPFTGDSPMIYVSLSRGQLAKVGHGGKRNVTETTSAWFKISWFLLGLYESEILICSSKVVTRAYWLIQRWYFNDLLCKYRLNRISFRAVLFAYSPLPGGGTTGGVK